MELPVVRGDLNLDGLPSGLRTAVNTALYRDTRSDLLERLLRGMKRLTVRDVAKVGQECSGIDKTYVRDTWQTLSTLDGLFWWNDGKGETRRRILLMAWKKGAKT